MKDIKISHSLGCAKIAVWDRTDNKILNIHSGGGGFWRKKKKQKLPIGASETRHTVSHPESQNSGGQEGQECKVILDYTRPKMNNK